MPTDVSKREDVERLQRARAIETFGEVAFLMNNAGRGGAGATLRADRSGWKAILDTNLWGVINGVQVFGPAHDRAEDAGRDRQHRLEAGDHLPARQHRLQCLEGRREGGDGGARARAPQHRRAARSRRICSCRASPSPASRPRTEGGKAGRRVDGRAGRRLHAAGAGEGRLLHPLPRQRGDARRWTRSACAGRWTISSRTARRCRAGIRTTRTRSRSTWQS